MLLSHARTSRTSYPALVGLGVRLPTQSVDAIAEGGLGVRTIAKFPRAAYDQSKGLRIPA